MLILALLLIAPAQGVPTPPPPPPPEMPADPQLRALVFKTLDCISEPRGAGNAAEKVTAYARNDVGSSSWIEAKKLVDAYVKQREAARVCIDALNAAQLSKGVSSDDRRIIGQQVRHAVRFWMGQLPYQADMLARLIGIDSHAAAAAGYRYNNE